MFSITEAYLNDDDLTLVDPEFPVRILLYVSDYNCEDDTINDAHLISLHIYDDLEATRLSLIHAAEVIKRLEVANHEN